MAAAPNILICDDDPVVHESLSLYLDNDNFTHIDAYDGRESLEMALANKPSRQNHRLLTILCIIS